MINQIITNIKQDLSQILTPDQMEALSRTLNKHLPMLTVEKAAVESIKNDMLPLFIAAKRVEGCSEKSLRYYESTIRNMLETINKPECQISTEDLRGYLDTYQRRGTVSKVTLDNVRRILSSFFAWLEDEDYIVKSPVRRIHKVKTGKTVKETYSDEALELMRDHCDNTRDLAMIDLLTSTGIRVGELVKLNRSDLDFENRECIVFGKGNKQRKVYFDARTKIHLQRYLSERTDGNESLFVSLLKPYERLQISGVEIRLRKIGRELNFNKVHPHKFRRTLATMAIDKGMPIEQVQQLLGHQSIDVKIIWYEVGESEDAISLFTRLNIGKIPLTSAELVKAMFLSRDNAENMRREKQEEISLQWDGIERELHNESLWFFLTNSVKGEYQTRIDLVLDLIAGKDESTREKYYTFFRFDELRKEVSLDDIWKKIYQTFLTLKGWYEDHDLYHRIGYLITSGTSLHKIFALSKDKKKSEFNESLDELIKKSVAISGNYAELSYEKPLDYKRISTLLLLFNIESVRRSDGHAQRFPFDQFKHHKGSNVTWSLEHIHAQQSEGMKTQDVWKKWLELHIPSVESIGGEHSELIDEMQGAINADKLERTVFESIQQKVLGLLSVSGNTEYMHSIANLALLNTADNAALNNSTFDVKRNDIIQMDKRGQYIPFCTKMVFLKYYTPSAENQLHFWGQADRIAYIKAINDVLSDYIEPIVLEKEETK